MKQHKSFSKYKYLHPQAVVHVSPVVDHVEEYEGDENDEHNEAELVKAQEEAFPVLCVVGLGVRGVALVGAGQHAVRLTRGSHAHRRASDVLVVGVERDRVALLGEDDALRTRRAPVLIQRRVGVRVLPFWTRYAPGRRMFID